MKRIFLILLMNTSYSINEYPLIKIKDITSGKDEGQIGWEPAVAGGFSGPTSIAISKDNKLYVPDRVNYRINIYDLNFNFIKTIIEKTIKKAHFTQNLKIDDDNNIIYLSSSKGLVKINSDGDNFFSVAKKQLPRQVTQYKNFFPIADKIFIYNDENKIECITNKGEFIKGDKIKPEIKKIENKWVNESQVRFIELPDNIMKIIEDLQQNSSLLIINNNFYDRNFRKNREYFEKIKDIREYVKLEKAKVRSSVEKKEVNLSIEDFSIHFFDYDANHNSYWMGIIDKPNKTKKFAVIIYSKYGELLDAFYYGQYKKGETPGWQHDFSQYPTSGAEVAIAPAGDVYFLVGNKEKYTLYKVECRW